MNSPPVLRQASHARRVIAERIAPAYAGNDKVAAILLGGSTARGDSDQYSDLELGIFWNQPPTELDRHSAIERSGGDLHHLYPFDAADQVWADDWKIGRNDCNEPFTGVSVDMQHMTINAAQRTIDAVVKTFDPDANKHGLIAAIRMGVPLHGEALITRWRSETDDYPPQLMRSAINRFAQIDHFWRIEMWRERRDLTGVHGKTVATHGAIFHTLLALNRIYAFGLKHRDTLIAQLKLAPKDLSCRLDACFDTDHVAAEQTLRDLVEEIYDLIEQHVPDVDVKRLRRIFRYRRPLWDEMPPRGL